VIEMNIGNERNSDLFPDVCQGSSGFHIRNGYPDNFTTGLLHCPDLPHGRLHIPRIRTCHGLYDHWGISSNLDATDKNGPCFFSLDLLIQ
jgi:hypothetical protein